MDKVEITQPENYNRKRISFGGLVSKIGGDVPLLAGIAALGLSAYVFSDDIIESVRYNQLRNEVPHAARECSQLYELGSDEVTAINNYLIPAALARYGEEIGVGAIADVNPNLAGEVSYASDYLIQNNVTPLDVTIAGTTFDDAEATPDCVKTLGQYTNGGHF